MAQQGLGGGMALLGRDRQPTNGGDVVLCNAPGADHVHMSEIILRVRVAEDRRRILESLGRTLGVWAPLAVGYAIQAIDADGHKRVGNRAQVSPVGLVL